MGTFSASIALLVPGGRVVVEALLGSPSHGRAVRSRWMLVCVARAVPYRCGRGAAAYGIDAFVNVSA